MGVNTYEECECKCDICGDEDDVIEKGWIHKKVKELPFDIAILKVQKKKRMMNMTFTDDDFENPYKKVLICPACVKKAAEKATEKYLENPAKIGPLYRFLDEKTIDLFA